MKKRYLTLIFLASLHTNSSIFANYTDTLPAQTTEDFGCNIQNQIICVGSGDPKSKLCQIKFWNDTVLAEPVNLPPASHTQPTPGVNYSARYRYESGGQSFPGSLCVSSGDAANVAKAGVRDQLGLLPERNDVCGASALPCVTKPDTSPAECEVLFLGKKMLNEPIVTRDATSGQKSGKPAQNVTIDGTQYNYRCWTPATVLIKNESTGTSRSVNKTPREIKDMLKEKLGLIPPAEQQAAPAAVEIPDPITTHLPPAEQQAAPAAVEIPDPITTHQCGTHSHACRVKAEKCIFNVNGVVKTVDKTAKGITLSPKYSDNVGPYGCMSKQSFEALP